MLSWYCVLIGGRWLQSSACVQHDDVIKWKHFPRYWPFVWGIHRSPVNSPHKGQWRGALIFSLINGWANNREAGDLRRYRAHYDVTVMVTRLRWCTLNRPCWFTVTDWLLHWRVYHNRGFESCQFDNIQQQTSTTQSVTIQNSMATWPFHWYCRWLRNIWV